MKEIIEDRGPVRFYTPDETKEKFVPLRNRIFDFSDGFSGRYGESAFNDESWTKIIIRGSLIDSDRTYPSHGLRMDDEDFLEWAKDDPRSELQPFLDMLVEDGVGEVIHMYPGTSEAGDDATTTRPTYHAVSSVFFVSVYGCWAASLPERLLFDETERWGFYATEDDFGLLGGESSFMERYIERVGGMDFIREKADAYWQVVLDENSFEARYVANYYRLAGWDNPPVKKESGG